MDDRMNRVMTGPSRIPLVNLIICLDSQERYVLEVGPDGPRCPRIALAGSGTERLGPRIEAAARSVLSLEVTYVEILSFEVSSDASDMYALVTAREPEMWPMGTTLLTLPELVESGAELSLIRLFRAAASRTSAAQFAVTIGGSVQGALAKSVAYLEDRFTMEGGRAGWSQYLDNEAVGVLSSAQGLLALTHTNVRSRYIEPAAKCLADAQNPDGGWQVKHSLAGEPTPISITESTCYCLWALIEAGTPPEALPIASGAAWLLKTQRRSGGWGVSAQSAEAQVVATSFAVRILTSLGYQQAVVRGVEWLRSTQCPDGGWPFQRIPWSASDFPTSPAATAHALITLRAADVPTTDPAILHGVAYLRKHFNESGREPWHSTVSDTLVDSATDTRLLFRHYTTPWALVALSMTGADLSDPIVQHGISRLLDLQMDSGAWRCFATYPGMQTVWAAHDAVFALKTVVSIGVCNLAPMALRGHADRTIAVLESMIAYLLSTNGTIAPETGAAMGA